MTNQVQHNIPRTDDTTPWPSWSDDAAWTAAVVADIAQVPCQSVAELVATYGTADPVWLRNHFALDDDVEAAERFAETRQVAA